MERLRSEDPLQAVHGLAELRSIAIGAVDEELLSEVNVPSSPAAAADLETIAGLHAAGVVLDGFTTTVDEVTLQPGGGAEHVLVALRAATSAYREVDAGGNTIAERPAVDGRPLQLVLQKDDGSWKISEVLTVAHAPTSP